MPAPSGTISYTDSYNAATMFFNYGSDTSAKSLHDEIRNDLKEALLASLRSKFFARSEGFGIETYENEPFSSVDEILTKTQLILTVEAYNAGVPPERQVVTAQELITIQEKERGSFEWKIQYYLLSNLQPQAVTVPTGGP